MSIASYIDHTVLKPTTTLHDVENICKEALQYQFAAVCVPPNYVKIAATILSGSKIKVATVISFPFGYSSTNSKKEEIMQALADGAEEIDMVHNISVLKNGDWDFLSNEISTCLQPVRLHNKIMKVIIETGILTPDEIITCCKIYTKHKVDFVKTSTGYAEKGATINDVKLMRQSLPPEIEIKASGGIRDYMFAKQLIDAGATRIGTSAGVNILMESKK